MQTAVQASAPELRRLPRRIKVGIGFTIASLVTLVFPGYMALPLSVLTPLMPRTSGCANFLAPIILVAFFGASILMSGFLILLGIVAVIAAIRGSRFGLIASIVLDAVIASLLTVTTISDELSLGPPNQDTLSTYSILAFFAIVPAIGLALLLAPSEFRSWRDTRRSFLATCVVVAVLVAPGAVGLAALGLELNGVHVVQVQSVQSSTSKPARAC